MCAVHYWIGTFLLNAFLPDLFGFLQKAYSMLLLATVLYTHLLYFYENRNKGSG